MQQPFLADLSNKLLTLLVELSAHFQDKACQERLELPADAGQQLLQEYKDWATAACAFSAVPGRIALDDRIEDIPDAAKRIAKRLDDSITWTEECT